MGKISMMQENVSYHLNKIAENFKGTPKITLLVRNPAIEGDADVVLTNDTFDEAISALQRRKDAAKS